MIARLEKLHFSDLIGAGAVLFWVGCLSAPPPPEDASLSGVFLLEGEVDSEGIEVILPGTAYRGYTNKEGKIHFDRLPPGEYEVLAQADNYQDYRESKVSLSPGDHIFLGEIPLVPLPTHARLSGTVVVEETEGAAVEVRLLGANRTIRSASDGRFEFVEVHPGKYEVAFFYPGAVAADPISVTLEAGVTVTLGKTVLEKPANDSEATGALEGVVLVEGEPEAGGVDVFVSGTPHVARTRVDGTFWLEGVESGTRTLLFEKDGYAPYRIASFQVLPATINQVAPVRLERKRFTPGTAQMSVTQQAPSGPIDPAAPGILSGYAFYPDREDHSGIRVRTLESPNVVETVADGSYLLPDVPPGLYTVRAESEGYQSDQLTGLEIRPGEATTAPNLELAFGAGAEEVVYPSLVYGQIVLADKGAQPGISVSIEGTSLVAVTDREGRFVFENIFPGEYEIVVAHPGYHPFSEPLDVPEDEDVPVPVITLDPEEVFLEIVETNPQDGARKVEVSDRVVVTVRFTERLLARTVAPNITVSPSVTANITVPEVDLAVIELIRTQNRGVQFETDYTVTLGTGIESPDGHRLEAPYTIGFETGGPRILGSIPADGARDVILMGHEPIILFVNEMVNTKDLQQKILIRPDTGEIAHVLARRTPFGARVEIQLPLREEKSYRVNIPRTVRTVNNNRYENTPYTIKFTSGAYDDLPDATDLNAQRMTEFEGVYE